MQIAGNVCPQSFLSAWKCTPTDYDEQSLKENMHVVQAMHDEAAATLVAKNSNYIYVEKARKRLAQTFLFITGKNLCERIFGFDSEEWANWFKCSVVSVCFVRCECVS